LPPPLLVSRSCFTKLSLIFLATQLLLTSWIEQAFGTPAATVYRQKCASCHGADGGGMHDRYENPLYGDESVAELAERIAETMPEDEPESCVGEEARQIAEYIYREFYSAEARRAKGLITAPRIELLRLTVPQYRNAVADLVAAFTPPPADSRDRKFDFSDEPGLLAEYFQSRGKIKADSKAFQRIDQRIDFDFGKGSPHSTIKPDQFAIFWKGSFRTDDTGYYEFRIRSPNGVRLHLNTDSARLQDKLGAGSSEAVQPRLIDAWVSSGKLRTVSGKIFLLGGRRYPLRIEFFKYKDPTASVRLEWKPPHGVWAVIDDDVLSTAPAARTFVVDTPFPADDRSLGYERGSSVSQEWHTAITNAALATAEEVTGRLPLLLGETDTKKNPSKLTDFVTSFASTAFRRPLTEAENKFYRETLFQNDTPESAVRRAVLLVLTSPHFLYTDLTLSDASLSPHALASRLAFALWDSLPDAELRRVADLDRLRTPEQIDAQARRMLADPRARTKMQGFFRHWLELEERDLAKDKQLYPDFDETVIADLRRSLELFVDRVVWSPSSDYRELLQADYLLLNDRLQRLYAKPTSEPGDIRATENEFVSVSSHSEGRSGILTHPYLLSAFAYHDNTSPIHRGVFLTRNIIGRQLKPPPVAVAFENNDFAPGLTMREKVTELTRARACLSCHEVINPLGFALENFDAVGRWRTVDNNKPIDTISNYVSTEGATVSFSSARDIANFAVDSPVAHRAFITQVFQHLVRQSPYAYGPKTMDELQQSLVVDNFNIKKLLVRIATRTATHVPGTSIISESQP